MSGIHLQSGKREQGLTLFLKGVRENPVTFTMVLISVLLVCCFFSPLGPFFVRHHQLFGALAAVMIVPTGVFVWIMYMKYEDRKFMEKYNERVRKMKGSQKMY